MRMMTGSLLILAGAILMAVNGLSEDVPAAFGFYAMFLTGIGWLFLLWGVLRDILAHHHGRGHWKLGDSR